ncbi:MAG: hypothetical protein IJV15_11520, partial [Lachnospiraceae bacterium]|nr:hypothetical protein [Lachnospiraceae bacterium]
DRYYFRYKFVPEDLDNKDRHTGNYTKKQVINYLNMTKEAHSAIVLMTMQGDIETSCNLLVACQESAVNIGELLEKTYGEGFEAVHILEEYCESVYQLYQALINGEFGQGDADGISAFLGEIYGRMTDVLNSYVINRKEMVFIPYRADYWKSMEPMWKKVVCEGTYDVYVVPIPYYKKTARSELADMYYEADEFPDYVELTDYKSYDFARRHPDVIVTMNPFDECNYTISLSREHFSKNLKKHTEELVYISPYVTDEIGLNKETKAWKTLDYFCTVPGVVHADRVIVQSDRMRQTYIERLTDMSGEEYRNVWTEKVEVYELFLQGIGEEPITGEINSENDDGKAEYKKSLLDKIPSEWEKIIFKSDGGLKKILLYNVGIASIAQYGDKTLIKIEDTLEKFKESKDDIAVIWYCNPHLIRTLKGVDLKLRDGFRNIVERYKSEGWGIYDESYDYSSLIELCDAYYGDSGNIPHVLRYDKKPVMLQNVDIVG